MNNSAGKGDDMSTVEVYGSADGSEQRINREHLIARSGLVRCIDDRYTRDVDVPDNLRSVFVSSKEADAGTSFLGASMISIYMLAETAPEGTELSKELVVTYAFDAHERTGLTFAVHMDDHHGELVQHEIIKRVESIKKGDLVAIPGCGADGLSTSEENPFDFNQQAYRFFQENKDLLPYVVFRGARLAVYGGNHASKDKGEAWAVRNTDSENTISRLAVTEDGGIAPYVHDDEPFNKLMEAQADILEENGHDEWANNLRLKYKELNDKWVNKGAMLLAGKLPVTM